MRAFLPRPLTLNPHGICPGMVVLVNLGISVQVGAKVYPILRRPTCHSQGLNFSKGDVILHEGN